jgi:hypothetical protein
MKWIQHDTSARNDVKIKILKKKFGAEGYGIYFQLLEIIGESIEKDNFEDWGFVDKHHTVETLADEVGTTSNKLRSILELCNQLDLFQKFRGRLYCHQILHRLDTYVSRYAKDVDLDQRKIELESEVENNVQTNFEQTSNKVRLHKITEHNSTEQENTEQKKTIDDFSKEYLDHWNLIHGTQFSAIDAIKANLEKRMKSYSFEQIKQAIEVVKVHHFWKNKMKPVILLRSQNTAKEPVDYIGEMLNYRPEKKFENQQDDKYEGIE